MHMTAEPPGGGRRIELRLFGSLDLRDAQGRTVEVLLQQPKRAALLAYLSAVPGDGFLRRDTLLALFWPELDEAHARNALSAALRFIRKAIGARVIFARGVEELAVDESLLCCDVKEFERLLDAGDSQRALALDRGSLLRGFHVAGAPAFVEWVESERVRLRRRSVSAACTLADAALRSGNVAFGVHWAQFAIERAPDDEAVLRLFILALERSGNRSAALGAYDAFAAQLATEYDAEPSPETREAVVRIRSRIATNGSDERAAARAKPEDQVSNIESFSDSGLSAMPIAASARASGSADPSTVAGPSRAGLGSRRWGMPTRRILAVLGIASGAILASVAWRQVASSTRLERETSSRTAILLPDSAPLSFVGSAALGIGRTALAISPDGRRIVYTALVGGTTMLYVRELNALHATPLAGSEGGYEPFFSPDGQWIAFFEQNLLKKVPVEGGHAVALATVMEPMGGAWRSADEILVSARQGAQLSRVPAAGGVPEPVKQQPPTVKLHPQVLPGGDWILYGLPNGSMAVLSLETGEHLVFTRNGMRPWQTVPYEQLLYGQNPRWIAGGYITYVSNDGHVMALPFDADRMDIAGSPSPVLSDVRIEEGRGGAQYAVSTDGTLVHAPGRDVRVKVFVWVDHATGMVDTIGLPPDRYGGFDLSPDGRYILALAKGVSSHADLWLLDVVRGDRTRIRTGGIPGPYPRWWPDSERFHFAVWTMEDTTSRSYTILQSRLNLDARDTLYLNGVQSLPTPDMSRLLFGRLESWVDLPLDRLPARPPGGSTVTFPSFSPDGRWLAYTSLAGDQSDVFVAHIDRLGERHKVSTTSGEEAVWAPDGRQIIYRSGREWLAVDVVLEPEFSAGEPRLLFSGPYAQLPGWSSDIDASGRRQLVLLGPPDEHAAQLIVATSWFQELRRLAPRTSP